jgi:hypothetical protein
MFVDLQIEFAAEVHPPEGLELEKQLDMKGNIFSEQNPNFICT